MNRRSLDAHCALLARHLLHAALLALGASACGGKVFVDGPPGAGGAGGSGSSTTTAGSTGSGPVMCDAPVQPGNVLVYGCFEAGICPPAGSQEAIEQMGAVLDMFGPCPTDPDFCSCGSAVIDVPCGPDGGVESGCCYYAEMAPQMVCEGRPFTVGGAARTARIVAHDDWRADLSPDVSALDPAARRALGAAWAADAQFEHASVASFARFALELLALGAPSELVRGAQRAMSDEIRHAELCFGLASALSGEPTGPGPLAIDGALLGRDGAAAIIEAVVREGCIGETLAALSALAARDAASDHAVRAALTEIAADEAEHAALAWRTVAWALGRGDAAIRRAVERAFAEAVTMEGQAPPNPPAPVAPRLGAGGLDPDLARAYGRLDASDLAHVVAQGLRDVVRPAAAGLLAAVASPAVRDAGVAAPSQQG